MSASLPSFIIVDNSQLDCFIAEKMIQNMGVDLSISIFTEAKKAFEKIEKTTFVPSKDLSIILLDIKANESQDFQFIDSFEKLPLDIQSNYAIFLLSSSVNDRSKFTNYASIRGFFSKPLSKEKLSEMMETA